MQKHMFPVWYCFILFYIQTFLIMLVPYKPVTVVAHNQVVIWLLCSQTTGIKSHIPSLFSPVEVQFSDGWESEALVLPALSIILMRMCSKYLLVKQTCVFV